MRAFHLCAYPYSTFVTILIIHGNHQLFNALCAVCTPLCADVAGLVDVNAQQLDLRTRNSWLLPLEEVRGITRVYGATARFFYSLCLSPPRC